MKPITKWKFATVVFVLLTLSLTGILIWREEFRPVNFLKQTFEDTVSLVKAITSLFPAIFISDADFDQYQANYLRRYNNMTVVPVGNETSYACNIQCYSPQRKKRGVAATKIHSGCCVSSVRLAPYPSRMRSIGNRMRRIVEFDDYRQYYPEHICSSLRLCSGCTCKQPEEIHTAVVLKEGVSEAEKVEDVEIDYFSFDGCCICINT